MKLKLKNEKYLSIPIYCLHLINITFYDSVQYFLPLKQLYSLWFIRNIIYGRKISMITLLKTLYALMKNKINEIYVPNYLELAVRCIFLCLTRLRD